MDGSKGLTHLAFPDPSKTGVISINRADAGSPTWASSSTELQAPAPARPTLRQAYFWIIAPRLGSAASMFLPALPRTIL